MKIGEILELTQSEPLNKIAKERLSIGEKPTREALKKAGCFAVSGKKGWFYEGDPEVLEKSIYDFSTIKARANVKTKQPKSETTNQQKHQTNIETKIESGKEQMIKGDIIEKNTKRKRASFDLDVELVKELKIKAVLEEKNLYELVEEAIKSYLAKG